MQRSRDPRFRAQLAGPAWCAGLRMPQGRRCCQAGRADVRSCEERRGRAGSAGAPRRPPFDAWAGVRTLPGPGTGLASYLL